MEGIDEWKIDHTLKTDGSVPRMLINFLHLQYQRIDKIYFEQKWKHYT